MKKILYIIIGFFISFPVSFAGSFKDGIIEGIGENTVINDIEGKKGVESLFEYTKNTIFDILAVIVIGTFLYIGYKIIISKGNPEEFKKAFLMLIYAVLGLLFIALSWVIVVFISGLKF